MAKEYNPIFGMRFQNFDEIKNSTIVKLPKKTIKALGLDKKGNSPHDFLGKYVGKKEYEQLGNLFKNYLELSFGKDFKKDCEVCNGDNTDERYKKCYPYHTEAKMNFFMAAHFFVSKVEANKHLIKEEQRKQLTLNFFECFFFVKGRVCFDLKKMSMHCLNAGLFTLSQIFYESNTLRAMSVVNDNLNVLLDEKRKIELLDDYIPFELEPQIEFFEQKAKNLEKEYFIEKESGKPQRSKIIVEKNNTDLVAKVINEISVNGKDLNSTYKELKSSWLENNKDTSEIDFIDSFDFSIGYDIETIDKRQFTQEQINIISELSTFLGKHRGTIARTPNDHYNQYLKSKRFGFLFLKTYKSKEFQGFIEHLKELKERYLFILNKLPKDEKLELKNDFSDQLERLRKLQNHSKFKELINDTISEIEAEYQKNKEPQQSNEINSEKVSSVTINPYPETFPNPLSFRLFERLYNEYKDSKTLLADFSFIYRKMYGKNGDYLHEFVKPETFKIFLRKEPFNIDLDHQLKRLEDCKTDSKERNYQTIFDLIKNENDSIV